MTFEKLKQKWDENRKMRLFESQKRKNAIVDRGGPIFKKYQIKKAVVFGSVVDGRCDKDADIDIFIKPLSSEKYWVFRRELEGAIGFPIDLYTIEDDPVFVEKIISRGVVVYEI